MAKQQPEPPPERPPLPANTNAERFVLGSILVRPSHMEELASTITVHDFALEKHKRIFARMLEIHEAGEIKLDYVTLANELLRYNELESVDGLSYLISLNDGLPDIDNIDSYVKILREHAARRSIMRAAQDALTAASLGEESPSDVLAKFEHKVDLIERDLDLDSAHARTPEQIVMDEGGLSAFLEKHTMGIPTGFSELDDTIYGLREGLYVVGADTSVGKSCWAGNVALNLAKRGIPSLIHTLEMSRKQYLMRLAVAEAEVPMFKVRKQIMNTEETRNLRRALKELAKLPIYIDDNKSVSIWDFERSVNMAVRQHGINVAFLDYIQLLDIFTPHKGIRFQDERTALVYATRKLKLISGRLKIPIVVLSQFHRRTEGGKQKDASQRPTLHDLHGSSSLSKDPDCVIFIYREDMVRQGAPEKRGLAELIVAKNRDGQCLSILLNFDGKYVRFTDPTDEQRAAFKAMQR